MTKKKLTRKQIRMIVVLSIIGFIILLTIISATFFPTTTFGGLINDTLGRFFNVWNFLSTNYLLILQTLGVLLFIWALNEILTLVIGALTRKRDHKATIWTIVRSLFKYGSYIVGIFLILSQWGVETPTLLAGAGILGLALSFGAQSLIEDVISGLFIIFEKQFEVGDIIQVNSFRGRVLDIGIRTTTFEDYNGDVMTINNSDLRMTINTSINPSPSICDVSIAYEEDVEKVEKILNSHLDDMKKVIPDILEGPFYKGVQSLGESGVVLRLYAKADETKKFQVTRDMNRYVKILFDKEGIEIPFNQLVVSYKDGQKKE